VAGRFVLNAYFEPTRRCTASPVPIVCWPLNLRLRIVVSATRELVASGESGASWRASSRGCSTQRLPAGSGSGHIGEALVKAIEMALKATKPEATQLVAAESSCLRRPGDHLNWEAHRRGGQEACSEIPAPRIIGCKLGGGGGGFDQVVRRRALFPDPPHERRSVAATVACRPRRLRRFAVLHRSEPFHNLVLAPACALLRFRTRTKAPGRRPWGMRTCDLSLG
jgi:hypothetical protein